MRDKGKKGEGKEVKAPFSPDEKSIGRGPS